MSRRNGKVTFNTYTLDGTLYPLVRIVAAAAAPTDGDALDTRSYATSTGDAVTWDRSNNTFAFVHNGQKVVTWRKGIVLPP